MMTDRELLELAAKAAGLELAWYDEKTECMYHPYRNAAQDNQLWNPLTDDGDALRLAVKLNMNFTLSGKHAAVAQAGDSMEEEYCNGDPYAATRRAIVRAAADIGSRIDPRAGE